MIRVGVVEEHEVYQRGIAACLGEQDGFVVCFVTCDTPPDVSVDVAVVSATAASRDRFDCPLVVCSPERGELRSLVPGNLVAGVLHRGTLTEAKLCATIRAVAAGLRVNAEAYIGPDERALEPRAVRVLELLAQGCSTREIAESLSYSERTVKKLIQELERLLSARSRAQVVATAIRQGFI